MLPIIKQLQSKRITKSSQKFYITPNIKQTMHTITTDMGSIDKQIAPNKNAQQVSSGLAYIIFHKIYIYLNQNKHQNTLYKTKAKL